ncbi:NAD-dependent epimerase/dehydratase family protein [Roseospira visakhapatnamensis]|uniref:Nucleoside-diphosphate-sugar epimerase n=1 Tax=Roseospira visakhapatnamensis TaxID=390880 RepID=A0A7W6RCZ4_9PROT|nr:NAD-dependent epimerase/dehydratase family protein [Roseospira visakhapatnamensis]MBB4266007.1 nucleoside-diphosphate-sugar epimerase [Roseospira visakhapatnamensis]
MPTFLVTGAAGFLGRHVTRTLAARQGTRVRAGVRRPDDAPFRDDEPGVAVTRADVRDPASIRAALDGCDAVVHCAVGDWTTTVGGARVLMEQARRAGVRRVVAISSIAVHGEAEGRLTEDAPLVTGRRDYAGAKAEAERVFIALGREAGAPAVTLLRPTIVYGPGSALWIDGMARRIRSGRWGTFGPLGEGTCHPVHVEDVAAAAAAALDAGRPHGEALFVNGPERLTWNAYFTRLAAHLGAPPLPSLDPATVRRRMRAALPAKVLARLLPPLRPWLRPILDAAPAASELRLFALKADYPTDRAEARLDWRPRVLLEDGLARAVVVTPPETRP